MYGDYYYYYVLTIINKYVKTNGLGKRQTHTNKKKWKASFCWRKSQRNGWRDDVILGVKNPTVGSSPQEFIDHIQLMITCFLVSMAVVVNVYILLSLVAANFIRVSKFLRQSKKRIWHFETSCPRPWHQLERHGGEDLLSADVELSRCTAADSDG